MRNIRSLKRTVGVRAPKKKFIIFTEGKNTEPDYFKALKYILRETLIDIEIIDAAGVPKTIAKRAAERSKTINQNKSRNSFQERDEVWAVFDLDEHPDVPEAVRQCEAAKIGVALSNPCFELWLILHISDFDRPDGRNDVQKYLERICADYKRSSGKTTDCTKLVARLDDAERRAELQLARRAVEGAPFGEPSTTVFRLTRKMRAAHEANGTAAKAQQGS